MSNKKLVSTTNPPLNVLRDPNSQVFRKAMSDLVMWRAEVRENLRKLVKDQLVEELVEVYKKNTNTEYSFLKEINDRMEWEEKYGSLPYEKEIELEKQWRKGEKVDYEPRPDYDYFGNYCCDVAIVLSCLPEDQCDDGGGHYSIDIRNTVDDVNSYMEKYLTGKPPLSNYARRFNGLDLDPNASDSESLGDSEDELSSE